MKHLSSVILIFVFCIASLSAQQNNFEKKLYVGVNAGATAAKIDFMPSVPELFKYGVVGGVSAKYISEKYLGLILEVNFSQRGWKEDFTEEPELSYERTLNYIEVPLMTHVYAGSKNVRFIFNAGPQVSFLLSDNSAMSESLAQRLQEQKESNPDTRYGYQYRPIGEMNKVDYGIVGGMGVELNTAVGTFDLEGRYYFGLGDVFTNRRNKQAYFSRSAHRLIEAKLTYYFRVN
ncbi:MAG: porin family protein [Fermentimonas sp.]|jgi:hypothetical protein